MAERGGEAWSIYLAERIDNHKTYGQAINAKYTIMQLQQAGTLYQGYNGGTYEYAELTSTYKYAQLAPSPNSSTCRISPNR